MAETTIPAPFADTHAASSDSTRWRVVGALGLSHVGVMLAAFALEGVASAEHGKPASSVLHTYASASMTRVELASYVEAMAFLPLLAALVVLVGLLSRTETGRTAGQVALGLGVAYVASTFAVGFPPLTAAVYAAHHGVDAATLATVNDIRNYGFLLQVALSAALALALGVAAIAERTLLRWLGWGGAGVGALGIVAAPFAHNAVSMVWLVWWVGVSVLCLKGGARLNRMRSMARNG